MEPNKSEPDMTDGTRQCAGNRSPPHLSLNSPRPLLKDQRMAEKFPRDPANGCLIGPDGSHYDTEHEVYHFAVLGLCGCGSPVGAYNFVREVLTKLDRRKEPWIDAEDAVAALVAQQPDIAAHVLLHLLDTRKVMEHGGSIGGSWLNATGHDIVDAGPVEDFADHFARQG